MHQLLAEIRICQVCAEHLEHGPRPVLQASPISRIVIIGQAPGLAVHKSGVPWEDKSGDNLRVWMGRSEEQFYDAAKIALIPMGFCYPGKGRSGDLPPRPECAPLWHKPLLAMMKEVQLTLLIGQYAQKAYLGKNVGPNLTETIKMFDKYLPETFVLPHPSPRNNIWQTKHPWFRSEVLPILRRKVTTVIS